MTNLAGATVDQVTKITIAGQNLPIALGTAGAAFYKGSSAGDLDGIRGNLQAIANLVNSSATGWEAALAGYRLVMNKLRPNSPQDIDTTFALATAGDAAGFGAGFSSKQAQAPLNGGNDGGAITPASYQGIELQRTGFFALEQVPIFNLMVLPGDGLNTETDWQAVRSAAAVYCQNRRAFLLLDAPVGWTKRGC